MIQLRNKIIQELSDLSAQRTRAHYDAIVAELDPEAVDRYLIHHGLGCGGDALWRIAALAGNVIVLQSLFPSLAWVGNPSVELSLKKVQDDIELLFRAVQAFEDHLQQTES